MTMININNVVDISVVLPQAGAAPYSVNNLICFTKDTPVVSLTDSYAVYSSASDVATAWGSDSSVYTAAVQVFSQSPNIISGGGYFIVVPMLADEVLEQAIVRAKALIYFGGCSATFTLGVTGPTGYTGATGDNLEALRAAAVAQTERKLLFLADSAVGSLSTPGLAYTIEGASQNYARVLHNTDAASLQKFIWGYASAGMSINFSGVNTTRTMNLKSIVGLTGDAGMTQTILELARTVGADVYPIVAGQSVVLSHGANDFYDDVYNLNWLIGALEVAGFNYLRTTGTKIPQTENGMAGLKGAYRKICLQAVSNGFLAAGTWTGTDTFGDPEDFHRNIVDFGFYIYSAPVATQPNADRLLRQAPVIQIAIKYAGAIHSTDVIVNVNR
jgi:hypothetical protein